MSFTFWRSCLERSSLRRDRSARPRRKSRAARRRAAPWPAVLYKSLEAAGTSAEGAHPSVHFNDDARPPRDPRVAPPEPAQMSIPRFEVPAEPSRSDLRTTCRPPRPRLRGESRSRLQECPPKSGARQRAVPVGNLPDGMSVELLLSARITSRATTSSPIPFDVFVHSSFIAAHPRPLLFPASPAQVFHRSSSDWSARTRHRSCREAPPPRSVWRMWQRRPSVRSSRG